MLLEKLPGSSEHAYNLKNGKNEKTNTYIYNPRLPNLEEHIKKCREAYLASSELDDIEDEYGIYPYIAGEMDLLLHPKQVQVRVEVEQREYTGTQGTTYCPFQPVEEISLEDALNEIQHAYSNSTNYYYKVISNSGIPQSKRLLKFLELA